MVMEEKFRRLAERISNVVGTPWTFIAAALLVAVWVISGPIFGFSDTWQLVINTGTTIVTFLMVFLIQNTQNRDATAVQLKLDELLRAVHGARTDMINIDMLSDAELSRLKTEFQRLGEENGSSASMSVQANVTVEASSPDAPKADSKPSASTD